jgi:DNA repair exonuclease SbcCD nuclease subunit
MKAIVLGDLHFGIKSFDLEFFKNQKNFIIQLIQYMKENNINTIFQLGDFFDNRKIIDINFLNEVIKLLKEMKSEIPDLKMYVLLGNHDIYFRDTLDVSLIKILANQFDFITIIDTPTKIENLKASIKMFPWLVKNNLKKEDIDADIIMGHFEIKNFDMVRGHKCEKGLDENIFNGKLVLSGHFHLTGQRNNIKYVGTPYQLNWGDFGDKRGFYVLDTNTQELEFIENRVSNEFIKLIYKAKRVLIKIYPDESFDIPEEEFLDFIKENVELLKHSFLKVIVMDTGFEKVLDIIKSRKIVYTFVNEINLKEIKEKAKEVDNKILNNLDTEKFVGEYIENTNSNNKERLKEKLKYILEIIKEKS